MEVEVTLRGKTINDVYDHMRQMLLAAAGRVPAEAIVQGPGPDVALFGEAPVDSPVDNPVDTPAEIQGDKPKTGRTASAPKPPAPKPKPAPKPPASKPKPVEAPPPAATEPIELDPAQLVAMRQQTIEELQ